MEYAVKCVPMVLEAAQQDGIVPVVVVNTWPFRKADTADIARLSEPVLIPGPACATTAPSHRRSRSSVSR
jgi:hypothetical protein